VLQTQQSLGSCDLLVMRTEVGVHFILRVPIILQSLTSQLCCLSFSALTRLVGSFDPWKTSPIWPIMCLVGR